MKINIHSRGETEFALDGEYQEPAIREAIEDGCNDVASAIIDNTDNERSDISHDEYAVVSEDDGTVVWSGWLDGDQETPAPDAAERALAAAEEALREIARQIDTLAEPGQGADLLSSIAHAALNKIKELGQ